MISSKKPSTPANSRLGSAAVNRATAQTASRRPVSAVRPTSSGRKSKFLPKTWQKILFGCGIFLVLVLSIGGAFAYHYYSKVKQVQANAQVLMASAQGLMDQFKTQNFPAAKEKLNETKLEYENFKTSFADLNSLKGLPVYGKYIKDGEVLLAAGDSGLAAVEKLTDAVLPYADLLGFAGEGSFEGGTTEDRVAKIIETLGVITPELDAITADLDQMQAHLDQIDPSHYPDRAGDLLLFKLATIGKPELREQYADLNLRTEITSVLDTADQATTAFADYRPVIEKLPEILGGEGRKKYFVLFQNDNELRPTGGFLTAYSIINVENGKVSPETSDDIYELDKRFTKKISIPTQLGKYLTTESKWNLRDMNIEPDFKLSMDTFLENYQTLSGADTQIDGIIAIDTKVLTDLIDILGPVDVPGYGTFTTEPDTKYTDAPQVVVALSEIITRPVNYIKTDRKGVLGPMMSSLLSKVYSAPKEVMPSLFQTMIADLEGRHIQAYFMDPELQSAMETINAAGRMTAPVAGQEDFIAIVDANLGGAKSNLFISYDVVHQVELPEDGVIFKKVEVTYKNSRPGDNCNLEAGLLCLNSTNNDWQRVYLPAGAELVKAQGYKNQPEVYSENGFTIIDGFFSLDPNKTAKVVLEYTVPYTDTETYRLNIWKQGGVDIIPTLVNVNGNEEQFDVVKDTAFQTSFN